MSAPISTARWATRLTIAATMTLGAATVNAVSARAESSVPGTATSVAGGPVASPGCATPNSDVQPDGGFVVTSGDNVGRYLAHLPASDASAGPRPLVIDVHGHSETAEIQEALSGLAAAAAQAGMVGITPQINRTVPHWEIDPESTDIAFFQAVIDDIAARTCVDLDRVYVAGLSNGAMFTSRLACAMSEELAAVAMVAGVFYPEECEPKRAVPMVAFHGTQDNYLPYEGGIGPAVANLPSNDGSSTIGTITEALPEAITRTVPERIAKWAEAASCTAPSMSALAMEVELTDYACPDGVDVQLVTVFGGGHAWPGSAVSAGLSGAVGVTTMAISANDMILDFFSRFSLGAS